VPVDDAGLPLVAQRIVVEEVGEQFLGARACTEDVSPRLRRSRFTCACVARAPASLAAAGTYAPAARNLLATATPSSAPSGDRPTKENVMAAQ
jgi:hypothetical protein